MNNIKTDFYALGKIDNTLLKNQINQKKLEIKESINGSNGIYNRNGYSLISSDREEKILNIIKPKTLNELNINMNNYINPILAFKNEGNYNINKDECNFACYELKRSKKYASESRLSSNPHLQAKYIKDNNLYIKNKINKENLLSNQTLSSQPKQNIQSNDHYFYKNIHGNPIRSMKDDGLKKKIERTTISNDAPDWFNVVNENKLKMLNEKLNKEETISIFSKFQKWITVTPKRRNRKFPLEKEKIEKMDKTSKIMPNWMQSKYSLYDNKGVDTKEVKVGFGKKSNFFVEENNYPKSVFSYMDYRHNVRTKDEYQSYMNGISHRPKNFLHHIDDGTRFVVSKNKDMKIL